MDTLINSETENANTSVQEETAPQKPQQEPKLDLERFTDQIKFIRSHMRALEKGLTFDVSTGVRNHIKEILNNSALAKIYNILFLIQEDKSSITSLSRDRIYSALSALDKTKPILLIISSTGGEIEPAYLISKVCKEYSSKFVVAVPRRAKSAATLLALGADEIHMGSISELGPIDPQINKLPVLALSDSLREICAICSDYPGSSTLLSRYLSKELTLQHLGYYKRIAESAEEYAKRLLLGKTLPNSTTPEAIAKILVNGYKDHGFVIDKDEAQKILGASIVKDQTEEYKLANRIYEFIEDFKSTLGVLLQDDSFETEVVGEINNFYIRRIDTDT